MRKMYKTLKAGLGIFLGATSLQAQPPSPVITSPNPVVEPVANTGFQFLEGPLWVDSLGLLFSDIPANTVYRWSPATNAVTPFLTPSGNSNGLKTDTSGNLLLAQHGLRRVARRVDGTETAVASTYKGRLLNSPNDIAVKSSGSIFFTDPDYGLSGRPREIPFEGVYRVSTTGRVHPIDSMMVKPNGISFSPDESTLYVNSTTEKRIYRYTVVNDSTFTNKQVFATMTGNGGADGMVVDSNGFVYSTGPGGIWIYASDGTFIRTIAVPGQSTNVTIGNPDRDALYVTTANAVYRISNSNVLGLNESSEISNVSPLGQNYPNPVVSSTRIPLHVREAGFVSLEIVNAQGQIVSLVARQNVSAGSYEFNWECGSHPDGAYFVKLTLNDKVYMKSMILNKK